MPSKEEYWKNPEKHRKATRQYAVENPEWKAKQTVYSSAAYKKDPTGKKAAVLAWVREHPGYYMLKNAQYRAKRDGLPCTITLSDIKIPEFCPVLGIKLGNYRAATR